MKMAKKESKNIYLLLAGIFILLLFLGVLILSPKFAEKSSTSSSFSKRDTSIQFGFRIKSAEELADPSNWPPEYKRVPGIESAKKLVGFTPRLPKDTLDGKLTAILVRGKDVYIFYSSGVNISELWEPLKYPLQQEWKISPTLPTLNSMRK